MTTGVLQSVEGAVDVREEHSLTIDCRPLHRARRQLGRPGQNADLRDTFLNNGYQSIPVVVFFDKDWNEIGRWL